MDVRRFSHEGPGSVFDATAAGLWVGGGGFVSPRWSAGAELDIGGESETMQIVSVALPGGAADVRTTYASQRRSLTALAGFHSRGPSVRVGCYAGLSFTSFRREIFSNAPSIVLQQPSAPSVLEERVTAATVGVDVAVRLSRALAAVASVRAQGLRLGGDLSGFSVRPAVGLRVSF